MKLSFLSVALPILLACHVSSRDICLGCPKGKSVGAAYFITNHPEVNFVIASDIGTDGQVTLRKAVDTGGVGSHVVGPDEPDALGTQGAVDIANETNLLVTVNAGSNTLSAFRINPHDPTELKMIGKPTPSGGEFPNSVAFNKAGDMVCAVNSGVINGISCYSIDPNEGLKPIPNTIRSLGLNNTTPPQAASQSSSDITFTEDEKQLVVAVKGVPPDRPGFYAVWDFENGLLSENFTNVPPPQGGFVPFSMTIIPNQNAFVVPDPAIGYDIFDLADVDNGISSSSRSSANVIDQQNASCWSAFSPSTGNYYLGDTGTSTITEISIDDNLKSMIVKQHPQPPLSATLDFDIGNICNKDFLYILSPNASAVDVRSLDGPGQMTDIQRLNLSGPACDAGIPINPNNLVGMAVFMKQ